VGEFCKENSKFFYRGGKQTLVDGKDIDNFTKSRANSLVMGWGYDHNSFKVWSRYINEEEGFRQLNGDDDYLEVATVIAGGGGDGQLYVEHRDDESEGSGFIDYDSDDVEGLDDSDEREKKSCMLSSFQNFCNLQIMLTTKHKFCIVECLLCQ
jgi:hypothetical protein